MDNKLSLHLGKTSSILFGSKRMIRNQPELRVQCNGNLIKNSPSVEYLGLVLDHNLNCDEISKAVIKKVNSRAKFLYRIRKYLNFDTLKLLASSLILCYDYGCSFWFAGFKKTLKVKLQTAQNKVLRCVLNLHPRAHIGANEFLKLNWLPIDLRVNQLKLNHMYRILNELSPKYLREGVYRAKSIHNHNTRFANFSVFRPIIGNHSQTSFLATTTIAWNSLPISVQSSNTIHQFKRKVKEHLRKVLNKRYSSRPNNAG